jgi:peptidoglycan/LPS O-acetylase OafA/YrhL
VFLDQALTAGKRWLPSFARRAARPQTYPLGYMAALDGARGLMTLGVLAAHTRMALFPGAMVYMDVFFTMSGYLIASLLIAEYRRHGKINLGKFYLRRFKRLYPALAGMIAIFVLACLLFASDLKSRLTEAAASFFYLMDYWRAFGLPGVHYTGHTWSLAVEEQFYLLWPLCFIALLRLFGLSGRTAAIAFAAAAGFAAWRIWLTATGTDIGYLYNAFDMRADALLIGCGIAIALACVDLADYPRLSTLLANSLAPLTAVMLAVGFLVDGDMRWYYYVSPLFGALPAIIFIGAIVAHKRTAMHAFYEHPFPVFCGRICYGLYVWHFMIFMWVTDWAPTQYRYITIFLVGWPLTFAAAIASYYLLERHFMRTRPV